LQSRMEYPVRRCCDLEITESVRNFPLHNEVPTHVRSAPRSNPWIRAVGRSFTALGAAAWRCSNRRATGVESLAELQPTHRQLAVFASQVLVLRSGVSARFQRLFSSWQAPRASVGHVVPARGIVEKGDADDHEGSLGCRPSQPCPPCGPRSHRSGGRRPTADAKTRLSAGMAMLAGRREAVDARLPHRGQALNYSYPPPWLSMVPGDGGPDVGAFLRADRGCSFM